MAYRVFPACQLFRFNPVTLTPIELNEAVQMWMDRPRSIPEDMVTQLHIKDAEIARLKNQCNDKDHILQDRWNRIGVDENRIAYLKKLSTMQKATIDALGRNSGRLKDLRKRNSQKWRTLQKEQLTFRDPEWKVVCDIIANGFTMSEMTQKGPELFICPAHGVSEMCPTCHHSKPHEHTGETCNFDGVRCKKCIPYKEPAPTIPQMHPPSSEPSYIHVSDGSDKEWRLISMFELREIEGAINEECVGKNKECHRGISKRCMIPAMRLSTKSAPASHIIA